MEKKKQRPYSEYEKQLLIQLVQEKIGVVENRRTDGISLKKKVEAWNDITTEFNNSNVSQTAEVKQLKKMWQNLKTRARDAKTLEAQRNRTGGGPAPPEMGSLESQIIAVMPNVMPSIDVPIDSDTSAAASTSQGLDNDSEYWQPHEARPEVIIEIIDKPNELETSQDVPASREPSTKPIQAKTPRIKKSFDDIKKDLLLQEIENNKKKTKLELEKHQLEIEFLKKKYELELEILEIKKDTLKKTKE